jgi:hypothetical protein
MAGRLLDLMSPSAPMHSFEITEALLRDVMQAYSAIYLPGLVCFFESQWFNLANKATNNPLLHNRSLINLVASLLMGGSTIESKFSTGCEVLENRVIWGLVHMAYSVPSRPNAQPIQPGMVIDEPLETRNRVDVVEALITGSHLNSNLLTLPNPHVPVEKRRELAFWWTLGEYVRYKSVPQSAFRENRELVLTHMRNVLDGRENRDLLYSIAIVRELGPDMEAGYERSLPAHLDETDPRYKLTVAIRFLKHTSEHNGGMTNIGRCISNLARLAYIDPAVYVARKEAVAQS